MHQINFHSFKLLLIFISLSCFACSKSDSSGSSGSSGDPANLSVDVTVAQDESGKVTIQARAENAVNYEFDFGTVDGDIGTSADGFFEFVYENSGLYTLVVKAFGSSGRFIRDEQQLTVISGEPPVGGEGYSTPIVYDGWNLVWNDEFDGLKLNESIWKHEIGNGCPNLCGWGNSELEYYRSQNSSVENGMLTIEARNETFQSNDYTSTRIKTQGTYSFVYGRVDIRAKMPRGQGIWPALWMLGQNITSVGWRECGEIDIMEMLGGGGKEKTVHGTAHWENNDGSPGINGESRTLPEGLDEEFHVYSIVWDETAIRWYLDDVEYNVLSITGPDFEAFHKPFFFIMNVAVGGTWPGNPTAATEFPTRMEVDYIRVFQEQ